MPVYTEEPAAAANEGETAVADIILPNHTEEVVITKKPFYDFVKRAFDIVASFLALVVGFPVYLIIALIIVFDNPGNPFFVQERIGKDLKPFKMIKFRSMRTDAEELKAELMQQNQYENGVHFKLDSDPRITRVGKILRKTSLDELPQMINILVGSMSFIGPRPFIRKEQEQLPDNRLLVKPGLSCYWQITDTTKMSNEEQNELDYKYIRERSVKTDLKLIWLTIMVVFKGKNC